MIGGRARKRRRESELERIRETLKTADRSGLATQIAEVYSEEIVRLRGQMQAALDVLNDQRASHEFAEARARKILGDALKYEGWLRGVIERGGGDAA